MPRWQPPQASRRQTPRGWPSAAPCCDWQRRFVDQTPWLDELALAVADGRPIDWLAQNARLAADIDPGLIAPLRLVERVVRAHRETTFDIELEEMSVRIPAGDVQNLPEDPDDAAVTWGPLTIADRIGGGSYGDVYKAHDRRLDRTVALKLL